MPIDRKARERERMARKRRDVPGYYAAELKRSRDRRELARVARASAATFAECFMRLFTPEHRA
jgi:hypothetical protein